MGQVAGREHSDVGPTAFRRESRNEKPRRDEEQVQVPSKA